MADPLRIDFSYDHTAGVFFGQLANGTRFAFERDEVEGKLARNLDLYRRAVIAEHETRAGKAPKPFRSKEEDRALANAAARAAKIERYNARGDHIPDEELEIDMEGIEL